MITSNNLNEKPKTQRAFVEDVGILIYIIIRCTNRYGYLPDTKLYFLDFRLVRVKENMAHKNKNFNTPQMNELNFHKKGFVYE